MLLHIPATSPDDLIHAREQRRHFRFAGAFVDQLARGRHVTLTVRGELDVQTTPLLEERIEAAFSSGALSLALDLTSLHYLSADAMRVIREANDRWVRDGRRLDVLNLDASLERIFRLEMAERSTERSSARAMRSPADPDT